MGILIVASYWQAEDDNVPQFCVVWKEDTSWNVQQIRSQMDNFLLSGSGTKRISISRP